MTVIAADAPLMRHRRVMRCVFDLLGQDENALTAALAFTLAHSPLLLDLLVERLLPGISADTATIRVETRDDRGRTDLEIDTGPDLVVVEAKRHWITPGETQLDCYAPRVRARGSGVLVSLSDASLEWAAQHLPPSVLGVPVMHLPWTAVRQDLEAARARAHGQERLWLTELSLYLRKALKMRDPADSWTYCVAVSTSKPGDGGALTFGDFVLTERCYFHPFGWGSGWPKTPPNFLAFRWGGQVQRIQRVTSSEILPNLQALQSDIPVTEDTQRPHALYRLGPAMPVPPIPSGGNYRASRVWCLLDQLLTSPTLPRQSEPARGSQEWRPESGVNRRARFPVRG